jgi:hypothetical protein
MALAGLVERGVARATAGGEQLADHDLVDPRVLAQIDGGEVEAEDQGATLTGPQVAAGQATEAGCGQAALEEIEVGEIGRGVDVAGVDAGQGRAQALGHVPELLAPRLVLGARPRARRDLGQALAIVGQAGLEFGDPGGIAAAVGCHRQRPAQGRHVLQVAGQHRGALALEGGAGDVGGDVGVAVAIAADPGAPLEEGRQAPRPLGPARGQRVLELSVDVGRDLEQRPAEHLDRGLDLVLGRRSPGARLLGAEQRQHLGRQLVLGVAPGRSAQRALEEIEAIADRAQVIEDRAPPRLGRVGGQDRHHQRAGEQRGDVVGGQPGVAQRHDGGGHAVVGAVAGSQDPDALLLLGGVEQVAPVGEDPGDVLEVVEAQASDAGREGGAPARELAGAQRDRVVAQGVDQGRQVRARQLAGGLGQRRAQSIEVGLQERWARLHAGVVPRPRRRRAGQGSAGQASANSSIVTQSTHAPSRRQCARWRPTSRKPRRSAAVRTATLSPW